MAREPLALRVRRAGAGARASNDAVSIAVTLVAGANATLTLSPSATAENFYYTDGTANPASQGGRADVVSGGFVPFQVCCSKFIRPG